MIEFDDIVEALRFRHFFWAVLINTVEIRPHENHDLESQFFKFKTLNDILKLDVDYVILQFFQSLGLEYIEEPLVIECDVIPWLHNVLVKLQYLIS